MSSPLIVLHPLTGQPFGSRSVLSGQAIPIGSLARVAAGLTVSAPAAPFDEGAFAVVDASGTSASSPITINGNGRNIEGGASFVLAANGGCVTFVLVEDVWRQIATISFFQSPAALPILLASDIPGGGGSSGGSSSGGNGQDAVIAMPDANYALTDAEDACSVVRFNGGTATAQRRATWKSTPTPLNKRRFIFNETAFDIEVANAVGGLTDVVGAGLAMIVVFNSVGARNAHTAAP